MRTHDPTWHAAANYRDAKLRTILDTVPDVLGTQRAALSFVIGPGVWASPSKTPPGGLLGTLQALPAIAAGRRPS